MDGFLDFFKEFFKLLVTFLANLKTTGLFQLLGLDDLVESLIAKV
jgi:hypothetical protein